MITTIQGQNWFAVCHGNDWISIVIGNRDYVIDNSKLVRYGLDIPDIRMFLVRHMNNSAQELLDYAKVAFA